MVQRRLKKNNNILIDQNRGKFFSFDRNCNNLGVLSDIDQHESRLAQVYELSNSINVSEFVLWRWNGNDTSQFTRVEGDANISAGSFQGPTLEPAILFTGTHARSSGIWTINDLPILPNRYIIYAVQNIDSNNSFTTINVPAFLFYFQDLTHFCALAQVNYRDENLNGYKRDGGSNTYNVSASFQTPGGNSEDGGTKHIIEVQAFTASTRCLAQPGWPQFANYDPGGNNYTNIYFGADTPLTSSTWNDQVKSFAIGFNIQSGTIGLGHNALCHLMILKHPLDWET